ncbi:hypothetical protein, partial [Burkholderia sp. Se-20378]|uniref:hypothetical protein n=1 Tax=Burkholderia sp. Se-20378 TaxID=2703899 RepID=UPI00197FC866
KKKNKDEQYNHIMNITIAQVTPTPSDSPAVSRSHADNKPDQLHIRHQGANISELLANTRPLCPQAPCAVQYTDINNRD